MKNGLWQMTKLGGKWECYLCCHPVTCPLLYAYMSTPRQPPLPDPAEPCPTCLAQAAAQLDRAGPEALLKRLPDGDLLAATGLLKLCVVDSMVRDGERRLGLGGGELRDGVWVQS